MTNTNAGAPPLGYTEQKRILNEDIATLRNDIAGLTPDFMTAIKTELKQ